MPGANVSVDFIEARSARIGQACASWLLASEIRALVPSVPEEVNSSAGGLIGRGAAPLSTATQGASGAAIEAGSAADSAISGTPEGRGQRTRAPNRTLRVAFADHTVFEGKVAAEVFAKALGHTGLDQVAACGLTYCARPLVSSVAPLDRTSTKVGNLYVCTNGNTQSKADLLQEAASQIGIPISVQIIDPSEVAPRAA